MKSVTLIFLLLAFSPAFAQDIYKVPSGDQQDLATITGSRPVSKAKKAPVVFVLAVDGQTIAGEERDWDKPLALSAGKHVVALGIRDMYEEFELDACAGCSYQARGTYEEKSSGFIKSMDIELWLTKEPEGQPSTEHKKPKVRPRDVHFNVHFVQ
jgi:hypothetical protein